MTAEEHFAEAQRRIENWQLGEALDLSDLSELEEIPESIAELKELHTLNFSWTRVGDLSPLNSLSNLQILDFNSTPVINLSPLAELSNLQQINLGVGLVSNLSPLCGLGSLQVLRCYYTKVSDLSPLSCLSNLKKLECDNTGVNDLGPLCDLNNLEELICGNTQVDDLSALSNLSNLRKLECNGTQVNDLSPLINIDLLDSLVAFSCPVRTIPLELIFSKSLKELYLDDCIINDLPNEILSGNELDNCLPRLRAHFTDLAESKNRQQEAKLMIIGNGRVGKTQICRQLSDLEFEKNSDSTHGITISSTSVPNNESARFHLWDFGGQDIYHGTHALFMRSRSVFLLAWMPEMEGSETHTYGGMTFRNYPLLYWLNYIKQFGGTDCSVIIVQTQCDEPDQVQTLPSDVYTMLGEFKYWKALDYSVLNNRGRAALDEALAEAYQQIDQPFIGEGRQRVIDQLQTWTDDDSKSPVEQRQHRTIQYRDFVALCENTGDISSPELFLEFLHNCGNVFYQQGLFNNQIILDQAWALEAIYAIFNRDNCYKILKEKMHGKFDRDLLAMLLWNGMGFSEQEQSLFIDLMESCNICFRLDKRWQKESLKKKIEYFAPDLLPEEPPQDLTEKWQPDLLIESAVFSYDLLPLVLLRNFMAEVGRSAGFAGDYWHNGFFVPERSTQSRALITQTKTGGWQGEICIQTQGAGAEQLLKALIKKLERVEQKSGIRATQKESSLNNTKLQHEFASNSDMKEPKFEPDYAQEKPQQKEYFVSYAWSDDKTDAGKKREEKVNQLCTDAEEKFGISIVRDKNTLQFGDSITKFMNRIGKGERVFIFLSDKYLKSANCMYELHQIWIQAQQNEDRLSEIVRVYVVDNADIRKPVGRMKYAAYWRDELRSLDDAIKEFGHDTVSERDWQSYRAMKHFTDTVSDVLSVFSDRVQPNDWEDFLEYGFQE
ncbi:COR domain-containing protein [Sessilibacter corallicola]|uniref:Leucine-rich repeat domain-containing protein n=1 Tax=Sessilibacter corallicola TaxID=2904075 RepID=A0ABQ0A4P7_9GAMM